MENSTFSRILDKYLTGEASQAERNLLEEYYKRLDENYRYDLPEEYRQVLNEVMLDNIRSRIEKEKQTTIYKTRWLHRYTVAAGILACMALAGYFVYDHLVIRSRFSHLPTEILPGTSKAILIKSDGGSIMLSGSDSNSIQLRNGAAIKNNHGQLTYLPAVPGNSSLPATMVNTLITPKGGSYRLALSDGTIVWLDAASSITYPVSFDHQKREVRVEGQAYFEIAHNAEIPFIVNSKTQSIEVLGTSFNIKAYMDESAVTTTLISGGIRVKNGRESIVLKPGEQAVINKADNKISVNEKDVEDAMAWKNGYFHFNGSSIPFVMQQIARWYNVDVHFTGAIPERSFSGDIDRNSSLSTALEILSISGVHFRVEKKSIIVTP
jgi:transmembrane sensor